MWIVCNMRNYHETIARLGYNDMLLLVSVLVERYSRALDLELFDSKDIICWHVLFLLYLDQVFMIKANMDMVVQLRML